MVDRDVLLSLVKRSLALKHKLKVFESLQQPTTHEDMAQHELVKWELEDELHAIQESIDLIRKKNILLYKEQIERVGPKNSMKKGIA